MQSNGGVGDAGRGRRARRALAALGPGRRGRPPGSGSSRRTASRDCITIDMGGTSFDAALVTDGEPLVMTDGVVDRWRIALPMIDIHTIGAGGGSIARVDAGGMLQVGPQSAGAEPGPACYGRGGTLPTTTDADLVLGFLADGSFLGGGMPLDRAAAARAIDEHVAQPLGLSRRGGGRRHLRHRQRHHGDRRARGQRAPRPRPARPPARGRGRRRARARRGDRRASSRSRCSWCRASRRSSAPRAC